MKRIFSIVIALIFICSLTGCNSEEKAKNKIFDLVEENYDAIVAACENKDADALSQMKGIEQVKIVDGYVLVYCMGEGIVPSSQDYGFYYSVDDRPVAVDCYLQILCDTEDLTPEGNGYQYISQDYNLFYTEHIKGNIYLFSTAY